MSELNTKTPRRLTYNERLLAQKLGVFSGDLPQGTVAHLKATVEAELLFLNSEGEPSSDTTSSEWFARFRAKDRTRKELDRLRKSITDIAELDAPMSAERGDEAESIEKQLQNLGWRLNTRPSEARECILAGIVNPKAEHAWRRSLVIVAETVRFSEAQDSQLTAALADFIIEFQDSNDPEDRIAVCSAIRSYIGLVRFNEIDTVARFLETRLRTTAPLETVLETVKMVRRKYAANPPACLDTESPLLEQLHSIACAFVNPHVLPHGLHAALVMNAVQALAAMASTRVLGVIDEINRSAPVWFRQQLGRRLSREHSRLQVAVENHDEGTASLGLIAEAVGLLRTAD